jgi:hypothetical protein
MYFARCRKKEDDDDDNNNNNKQKKRRKKPFDDPFFENPFRTKDL